MYSGDPDSPSSRYFQQTESVLAGREPYAGREHPSSTGPATLLRPYREAKRNIGRQCARCQGVQITARGESDAFIAEPRRITGLKVMSYPIHMERLSRVAGWAYTYRRGLPQPQLGKRPAQVSQKASRPPHGRLSTFSYNGGGVYIPPGRPDPRKDPSRSIEGTNVRTNKPLLCRRVPHCLRWKYFSVFGYLSHSTAVPVGLPGRVHPRPPPW